MTRYAASQQSGVPNMLIWRYFPHPKPLPQDEGGAYFLQNCWKYSPSLVLGARGRGMGAC